MVDVNFRRGDSGPAVIEITTLLIRLGLLAGKPVAAYDEAVEVAVRTFQQRRGLSVDGIVGVHTYRRLDEARWQLGDRIITHLPGRLLVGDDVYALQQRLLELGFDVGKVDGYFGPDSAAGLREFQRNLGLPADGTCGPATLKALAQLSPMVLGGAPNEMRADERIREAGPHLGGKTVVLDAGRAHSLPARYAAGSDEIVHDLAQRIEGRLVAIGVQAFLTSPLGAPLGAEPAEEDHRAQFANRTHADLFVSLALDYSANPDASGASTYFFGAEPQGSRSSAGERFAGLIQREVVARTDLVNLRTHAKSWDLLRRTTMPAVRLDAGYLTNAGDAARLEDSGFRDVIAEAVLVAIQRFYLSPDADEQTGVMRISDLRSDFARLPR